MNPFQSLNLAIFAGTIAALLAGLARITSPIGDRPIVLWLFVAFIFVFRLKLFLDDHKYFAEAATANAQFKVGLTLGMASWFFWGLAASSVPTLRDAYGFTFIALALSTAWIVVANLPDRYGKKDVGWAVTNTLLLVVFGAVYAADSPTGDMITSVAIGASIAIAVLDFILSKSIFELPVSS
jgi:hypothetical protein